MAMKARENLDAGIDLLAANAVSVDDTAETIARMREEHLALDLRMLIADVEGEFPGTRSEVRPHADDEDPAVRWFLWILDAPRDRLAEIEDYAIERAFDIFGDHPPVCVGAVSHEVSRAHFCTVPESSRTTSMSTNPRPPGAGSPNDAETRDAKR